MVFSIINWTYELEVGMNKVKNNKNERRLKDMTRKYKITTIVKK